MARALTARWHRPALIAARWLIAILFAGGALQKAVSPGDAEALLIGRNLPGLLVWPALIYNLVAAAALILNRAVVPAALSLALYCGVTSLFHFLPGDPWQMTIFVKNWAIAGGCLALAVAADRSDGAPAAPR